MAIDTQSSLTQKSAKAGRYETTLCRYRLFLQQKQAIEHECSLSKMLIAAFVFFVCIIKKIWIFFVPIVCRGEANQYEIFCSQLSNSQKNRIQQIIHNKTVEQSIKQHNGDPAAVLFIYSSNYLKDSIDFLEINKQNLKQYIVYPLQIQSCQYQQLYKPKIGQISNRIVVLWKGLFDELQVIEDQPYETLNLWDKINNSIAARKQFENYIKNVIQQQAKINQIEDTSSFKIIYIKNDK